MITQTISCLFVFLSHKQSLHQRAGKDEDTQFRSNLAEKSFLLIENPFSCTINMVAIQAAFLQSRAHANDKQIDIRAFHH